jgi:hypothetical protein
MRLSLVVGLCVLGGVFGAACGSGSDDSFNGDGGGAGGTTGKGGSSGSAGSTSGKGGTQSSSGGASSGGDGNEAGEAAGGASPEGGSNGTAGETAGQAGSANGGAPAGGAGNCPDVFGDYTITQADGTCGDFDDGVVQSLEGTDQACFLHFVSEGALNGGADLDGNGEFSDAQLYVGSAQRNPCSAEYDAQDGSMVVTCGGQGDACTVTLEPQ